MNRTALALAAATFALVGSTTPASADALPAVSLVITVSYSANDGSADGRIVGTLQCSPEGGMHNNPVEACRELVAADGDFAATDREMEGVCPLHYAPVEVRAAGWYGDSLVTYAHSYGNGCFFAATAGAVWNV